MSKWFAGRGGVLSSVCAGMMLGCLSLPLVAATPPTTGSARQAKLHTSPETADMLARAIADLDGWQGDSDRLNQAKRALDDVLQRDPASAGAYREYARYHTMRGYQRGDRYVPDALDQAERALNKAIELEPDYADAYVFRGALYRMMKRPAAAREALDKAEALGASDAWLKINRADLMLPEGRYDDALALYQSVLDNPASLPRERAAARGGQIDVHLRTYRYDDVDRIYRAMIAEDAGSAWTRGNYASFLLCNKDDYEAAIAQYQLALASMRYGAAVEGLLASIQRKWAAQVNDGRDQEALATLEVARIGGDRSAATLAGLCKTGPTVGPRIRASHKAVSLQPLAPADAIRMAAAAPEGEPVEGVFAFQVLGTGRDKGDFFLNSQVDYRDPATLTVRMSRRAADGFRAKYHFDPDLDLRGKRIEVAAPVVRTRISMLKNGIPTGEHYYQTHALVSDASQIVVID
ncbi:MAG: hypothetical protein HOQ32_20190 [Lysobacter sp.]|nr:hypothetical protein [Lysobacter sp.]